MKTYEIAKLLNAKIVLMPEPDREIEGGYCGDFLSFVMGRAPENCAWFTIMNNANVAAVAALTDIGVIVLCENVQPDESLKKLSSIKICRLSLPNYLYLKRQESWKYETPL